MADIVYLVIKCSKLKNVQFSLFLEFRNSDDWHVPRVWVSLFRRLRVFFRNVFGRPVLLKNKRVRGNVKKFKTKTIIIIKTWTRYLVLFLLLFWSLFFSGGTPVTRENARCPWRGRWQYIAARGDSRGCKNKPCSAKMIIKSPRRFVQCILHHYIHY